MSDTEPSGSRFLRPDITIKKQTPNCYPEKVIESSCAAVEKSVLPAKSFGKPCVFSVQLTDNDEIQALNATYRKQNKPTNVLSFEVEDCLENQLLPYISLGDIIISSDVLSAEAKDKNISENDHLAHLVTHGLLHLYGFNHIEEAEAKVMESAEISILDSMNIKNPYLNESII
jgi:probable rRNA maturation factor